MGPDCRGPGAFKVLIAAKGRSVAEDLARLTEVRSAIGADADLIADANCMMNFDTARRFIEQGHDLGLTWLEEPVVANDIGNLTKLSRMGVPLGAGQMEQSLERHRALRLAGVKVIQPNAVFLGGFQKAINSALDAASKGAGISMAGGWDFVNLHWICGALNDGAVELHRAQFRIARLLMRDMPEIANGQINVPDRLGLGLDPDDDALSACPNFLTFGGRSRLPTPTHTLGQTYKQFAKGLICCFGT
jgi:L-alanine-DL-glutamate epimerase and related enzymes of enolase superfamily